MLPSKPPSRLYPSGLFISPSAFGRRTVKTTRLTHLQSIVFLAEPTNTKRSTVRKLQRWLGRIAKNLTYINRIVVRC